MFDVKRQEIRTYVVTVISQHTPLTPGCALSFCFFHCIRLDNVQFQSHIGEKIIRT